MNSALRCCLFGAQVSTGATNTIRKLAVPIPMFGVPVLGLECRRSRTTARKVKLSLSPHALLDSQVSSKKVDTEPQEV